MAVRLGAETDFHSCSSLLSSKERIRQGLGQASASWAASGQSSWKPLPPWTGPPSTSCPWFSPQVRASLGSQGSHSPILSFQAQSQGASVQYVAHSTSSLCFEFAGLCAEPVLTQPPSASAPLGASAQLTCTLSSEYSTYTIRWYQQRTGNSPRYMMYIKSDGSHSKGDGIPERFSGSSSGADRYLTISHVQSEDEAEYICGESHAHDGLFTYTTVTQTKGK